MNLPVRLLFATTDPVHSKQDDEHDNEGDGAECGYGFKHSWYCNYYNLARDPTAG
jgi:hypothetical protein